ncbi:MAG: UDPGP type 1 family protein [Lentisphaerae bacterium]|nr:UDPGP type 1 family protein [Lentisphaerota bacterium]
MCENLKNAIIAAGQEHLLRFIDELSPVEKAAYIEQLTAVDWQQIPSLAAEYVLKRPEVSIPDDLTPAQFFPLLAKDEAMSELYAKADAKGVELLRAGKVCCLTVAGGQGTRLGFDGPKGTYPIGPVSGRTLFEYFAGSISRASEKYGKTINWYIMTSPINREATEKYFETANFFGLPRESVFFFTQGTMPAFGLDGKLLMSGKGSLALSPDGHGGTLLALRKSGALDKMIADGNEYISYFQVDNPLVPVVDPRFIGLHALENSLMSAIMLSKTNPKEKLGNFCVSQGRTMIIEYSDLPDELAEKRNADGSLSFVAGSPAIHVISRSFVESLTSGGTLRLPWHRADKKIPYLDAAGELQQPSEPNGVKLESFIFDALPLAEKVMILEGDRAEVFAPTKNATGVDSAESCREMITARNARRLALGGVEIPRKADGTVDAVIEISPFMVLDDADAVALVAENGLKKLFAGEKVAL